MHRDELEHNYLDAAANPAVPYNEVIRMREELVRLQDLLCDEDYDGFADLDVE